MKLSKLWRAMNRPLFVFGGWRFIHDEDYRTMSRHIEELDELSRVWKTQAEKTQNALRSVRGELVDARRQLAEARRIIHARQRTRD